MPLRQWKLYFVSNNYIPHVYNPYDDVAPPLGYTWLAWVKMALSYHQHVWTGLHMPFMTFPVVKTGFSDLSKQLRIQPCTPSTWPLSPTMLGIWPWDLDLSNEYTLGHCGLSAASRHKLASTSSHHSLLTATWHDSTLLNCLCLFSLSRSKLIFKIPTTTWGVPSGHILPTVLTLIIRTIK